MANLSRPVMLRIWVAVFFAALALAICSWGWDISPPMMALTTAAGFTLMIVAYRLGIDRCLPPR